MVAWWPFCKVSGNTFLQEVKCLNPVLRRPLRHPQRSVPRFLNQFIQKIAQLQADFPVVLLGKEKKVMSKQEATVLAQDTLAHLMGVAIAVLSFLSAVLLFLKNHNSWRARIVKLEKGQQSTDEQVSDLNSRMSKAEHQIIRMMSSIDQRLDTIEKQHDKDALAHAVAARLVSELKPLLRRPSN